MSGIAGVFYLDGRPVERPDLQGMIDILAHRGPDGREVWHEGPVGLAHTMLWTTPESLTERQPLAIDGSGTVITADARIDNRDELFDSLGLTGGQRGQVSDSELILRAYLHWGEECPGKLLGDFAFAIWDSRRQTLFCARDHLGSKPFYYYRSGSAFVFGSEIKALLTLGDVPKRLNETAVADFLAEMHDDKAITMYSDIQRLPAAHKMSITSERVICDRYWSLDPKREIRMRSNAEYADAFRDIFTEAVRCRLRSAYPVGSLFSGGLDSSSVSCVARDILRESGGGPLHTVSAIFESVPECDERPYMNAVLAQDGFKPHFLKADQISPLAEMDTITWHHDQVVNIPNMYMIWNMYRLAQGENIRVMLDGSDGDTTVHYGLGLITELARKGRWLAMLSEASALSRRLNHPLRRLLWSWAVKPNVPDSLRKGWRTARRRESEFDSAHPLINRDFARRVGLGERVQRLHSPWYKLERTARQEHHKYLDSGNVPFILEVTDHLSSAFGIESRHPYFDRRVVEYCLALPADQKLHQGWVRMIVRRALRESMPEEVTWRPWKTTFDPSFTKGLRTHEPKVLDGLISRGGDAIAPYVDIGELRGVYQRYQAGSDRDSRRVLLVTNLDRWLSTSGLAP